MSDSSTPMNLAISRGIPLAEETFVGSLTLAGYIREICQAFGEREAAVMHLPESIERWSYNDLWQQALAVAKSLVALGIGKGTRVGIIATNRLEFLSCTFGTALAGGIATTISTFFTASELDAVLETAGCSVLLLERHVLKKDFAAMILELEPQLASCQPGHLRSTRYPFLHTVAVVDTNQGLGAIEGWDAFLARGANTNEEQVAARADSVLPSDPGVLFFSSGSTGKAKGILSANRSVCLQLWRWKEWYDIQEPPRTWSANGFFFSGNFCMTLGSALSSGGTIVLQRFFDAEAALTLMDEEKATMLLAWPHQWAQLVGASNFQSVDLSSMVYIDRDSPIAQHPTINTDWLEPKHAYGSTETFTLISVYKANTPKDVTHNSHGLPSAGAILKIVDPFTGATLKQGERGEIAVKGPTLMLGYLGTPLAESLDDEGFFRTNDGGYIDEHGRLFWQGRLNDIIKTGGANVSPLEIDEVIRACPGVKISQTVGTPDELLGELVVSCIVLHAGASATDEEIRNFAKQKLASFKVPRRVLFFAEDELQTTGSAKIKTADLRKLASERLAQA
ncbi:class I adenylate-forming enzyme family protein [Halioxenophilus sp. WMMB6]|uniref:class I adenylate-forming enzyme family protein n=1 Tax=Halioxenophilus sp. WMMB6 TaxID=3073815 RepID=UPI00295F0D26|nr:AMP-binding protein [Halioxenophilus sp. WMMB6]